MTDFKKNIDDLEKKISDDLNRLEQSIHAKLSGKADQGTAKVQSWTCIAACPTCITETCSLDPSHSCEHQCSQGHHWV